MQRQRRLLREAYTKAHRRFGHQAWWPAATPFEVMVGAILTQNTNWANVATAIANLKAAGCLTPSALYQLSPDRLAALIRPAGYFNVKTKRLRNFLAYFCDRYDGDVKRMQEQSIGILREELLAVKGIGPETADSILLYALAKPVFVIDAYTHRILHRHQLAGDETSYEELQALFHDNLPASDTALFNDYHAQFVTIGKHFCRPREPKCAQCPLNGWNWDHRKD